jgi:plastocyanin
MKSAVRVVILLLVSVALVSCGGKSAPTQPNVVMTPTPVKGNVPTPTPGMGNGGPTPTPVPAAHAVSVGLGGNQFVDGVSGSNVTTIHAGQMVMWNWAGGPHSTTSGNCCSPDGKWDSGVRSSGSFSQTFPSTGSFPYFCTVHGSMMTGMVMVNP